MKWDFNDFGVRTKKARELDVKEYTAWIVVFSVILLIIFNVVIGVFVLISLLCYAIISIIYYNFYKKPKQG